MNSLFAITILLANFANSAFATSQIDLLTLWKAPSAKLLAAFKKSCHPKDPVDFDGGSASDLLSGLEKSAHVSQIRALVYAERNCADGASRGRLLSALGNEILVRHPAKLIEALHREKARNLAEIVAQENNDWFGVECENEKCHADRKAYFLKKRAALSKAKVKKEWEVTKRKLLETLPSDQ